MSSISKSKVSCHLQALKPHRFHPLTPPYSLPTIQHSFQRSAGVEAGNADSSRWIPVFARGDEKSKNTKTGPAKRTTPSKSLEPEWSRRGLQELGLRERDMGRALSPAGKSNAKAASGINRSGKRVLEEPQAGTRQNVEEWIT